MLNDIQKRIMELKKEKDVCILAHCYQTHDILEVADFVGDSFGLAQKAAKAPNAAVMMCGVRFMAETVKILSPEKRVLIPREEAGCPMAEQLDVEMLTQLRQMYPDHKVVAYINAPTHPAHPVEGWLRPIVPIENGYSLPPACFEPLCPSNLSVPFATPDNG